LEPEILLLFLHRLARDDGKGGAIREPLQGAETKLGEKFFGGISETVETMLEVLTSTRAERGELLLHGSDLLKATPLELAASKERPNLSALVKLMENAIEDPSLNPHFEVEGRTYLHLMAECGSVRLCKRLIQLGCKVRQVDDMGFAPVHVAAAGGHPMCLKLLLDEDESMINLSDGETNSTPLHYAALYGRARCVSLLLDRGARLDQLDSFGATAPMKAAYHGHKSVLRIVGKSAKLHLKDKENNNAFLLSCLQGHFACSTTLKKYLPRSEVSSSHQNKRGDTPIWGTFLHNNFDYLKVLLEDENPGGKKVFFEDTVKKMIGSHTMGPFHFQLLHRCLLHLNDKQQCYKMVRYLLSSGADPNARTTDRKTPLFVASFQNRVSCIPLLLNHGADVAAVDEDGNTALHFTRHVDIAAKILATLDDSDSRRHYCNVQNNQGNGALHVAFSRSDYDMATFLLTHGANPNLQNANGNRPEECIWSRDVVFDIPYLTKVEGGGIFMSPVNFCQNFA